MSSSSQDESVSMTEEECKDTIIMEIYERGYVNIIDICKKFNLDFEFVSKCFNQLLEQGLLIIGEVDLDPEYYPEDSKNN
jgi:predicted transcriptional regulator